MSAGSPIRVGLVVDHPKRDLPGGAMLAHRLAAMGAASVLVPLYDQAVDVPLLGLNALVVNFARPVNIELVRGYATQGLPVFVLDTEGGILAENGANAPPVLARYIRESGFCDLLAGYFFWGSRLHTAFLRDSGMPADRLHVTGCPRFDYTGPQWRELLAFPQSGHVLVNMNFTLVNPLFSRSPEEERAALLMAGWRAEYIEGLLREMKHTHLGMLEAVEALAQALPSQSFVVRPHPFENPNPYHSLYSSMPNVTVDGAGSVLNAIRPARCVLHLNCGTSVESVMLGRLPVSVEYLNTPHLSGHSTLPSMISYKANSPEALLDVVRRADEIAASFDFAGPYDRFIKPWFHLDDGNAAERVARVVVDAVRDRPRRGPSLAASLASSRASSRPAQRAQALAANVVGSRASSRLRDWLDPVRREKRIDPVQLDRDLAALAAHVGRPAPFVAYARHPLSGLPLASVEVLPR
jgi:surface carbohydrate biosynthesis protein